MEVQKSKQKTGRRPGKPKSGGRQPGSKNLLTAEMKDWIKSIVYKNQPLFEANLKKLDPDKHVYVIEKLLAYIVPKPQNIDIQLEYRELERLLEQTPERYIERISTKILELNTRNSINKCENSRKSIENITNNENEPFNLSENE